jgi:hypothetical protein
MSFNVPANLLRFCLKVKSFAFILEMCRIVWLVLIGCGDLPKFFLFVMGTFDWPITSKNQKIWTWTLQNRYIVVSFLGRFIGYMSKTYAKGYGIKWDAIGNISGNTLRTCATCWEHIGNQKIQEKFNTLPCPPFIRSKRNKNWALGVHVLLTSLAARNFYGYLWSLP